MRTYNQIFSVEGEENIYFQSIYAHIEERDNGLFCSLEGEYLKNDQPFNPPLRDKMSDVGVTTQDIAQIVTERYHSLTEEEPQ